MSFVKSFLSKNAGTASLVVVLAGSLGLNVFLALKLRSAGSVSVAVPTKVNAKLPSPLSLLDADGKPTQLTFDDSRPTVLYVFSPLCGWCKRNEANIKSTVAIAGSRFRFVGISISSQNLKEYIAQGHAPFPVYLVKSPEQSNQLGFIGTPMTIVVGPGARVQKVWQGAYMEQNQKEVEAFFGAKLPGLQDLATLAH
jgi:hypothetical protein